MTRLRFALILVMACAKHDGDPEVARVAGQCKAASEIVRQNAGLDDPAFKEALVNRLTACTDACDGKDVASCDELDDQVARMCTISATVCKTLCDPTKPGSLTDAACKQTR